MSAVSFLEKLLDGAQVVWVPLGELTTVKTGQSVNKNLIAANPGPYPVINSGREPLGFIDKWNTEDDPIGVTTRGAGVGSITWQEGKYYRGNLNYAVSVRSEEKLSVRFLYHLLLEMQPEIHFLCTFDGIPALNAGKLKRLSIPIPCPDDPAKSLAIQGEIVRILDRFTELTARKKQYNHYRDQLLTFDKDEVEWKTLEKIGGFSYGYAAKAEDVGDARFVRITDIGPDGKLIPHDKKFVTLTAENERYLLKKNDLVMARTGATFGKTMMFDEDYPAIYAGFLIKLELDSSLINPEYYWHFAQSDMFWAQAKKMVSGGGQPQFNANTLKKVRTPIPYPNDPEKSLALQSQIVSRLRDFDRLTSSLSEGLPFEIELREKQYAYYRDQLLSFPKLKDMVTA